MAKRPVVNKSVLLQPRSISDTGGIRLSLSDEMLKLRDDIEAITDLVRRDFDDDRKILNIINNLDYECDDLGVKLPSQNDAVGHYLGIRLPDDVYPWKTGRSRYQMMYQAKLISDVKAYHQRLRASQGGAQHMSAGWKRTADGSKPTIYPKMSLSAADGQYAKIINDPFEDGFIILAMVVSGQRRKVYFDFDVQRFASGIKVALPDVQVSQKTGRVEFRFSVVYDIPLNEISGNFVVGVDVGIAEYATVAVYSISDQKRVYSTTLSRRFRSLYKSTRATQRQVGKLARTGRDDERAEQRRSLSRKRREVAILAAQEIADLSYRYGNAAIIIEDLSWLSNTMENGRWNIGELRHWLTHYAAQNGTVVYKVKAFNTSRDCSSCGAKKSARFIGRIFVCQHCEVVIDRDVNAATNIAGRGAKSAAKTHVTRERKRVDRNIVGNTRRMSPKAREALKHPGTVDRTKIGPTRKQSKSKVRKIEIVKEVNNVGTPESRDDSGYRGRREGHVGTVHAASDISLVT